MRALAKVVCIVALALTCASTVQAATINLSVPSSGTETHERFDSCTSFLFFGGAHCTDRFRFTLDQPGTISIMIQNFGNFKGYSWVLEGTSLRGSGSRISGPTTIADLEALSLDAGSYEFKLKLKKGRGRYDFLISMDDPVDDPQNDPSTGGPVALLVDPPQTPIPGAALLFGSGLAALGFGSKRFRWRAKPDTTLNA